MLGVTLTVAGGLTAFGAGIVVLFASWGLLAFFGGLVVAAIGLTIWQGDDWTSEIFPRD